MRCTRMASLYPTHRCLTFKSPGIQAGRVMEALRALGLARSAGPDEVRQTYRSLAKGVRGTAAQLSSPKPYKTQKHITSSLDTGIACKLRLQWHSRIDVSIGAIAWQ